MLVNELVFLDTEFSSLNPYEGKILSLAMIKETGEELYVELACDAAPSEWVKEHILPTLTEEKISREEAKRRIGAFLGEGQPVMVTYVSQYDTLYFYKLYDGPETPFFWLPLDFASIVFAKGYDPEKIDDLYKELGIDTSKYHQHHALDDARLLREAYLKLQEREKCTPD